MASSRSSGTRSKKSPRKMTKTREEGAVTRFEAAIKVWTTLAEVTTSKVERVTMGGGSLEDVTQGVIDHFWSLYGDER